MKPVEHNVYYRLPTFAYIGGGGGRFSQTVDGRGDLAKSQDSVLPTLHFQFWGSLYYVMYFSIMSVVQIYTPRSSRSSLLTLRTLHLFT